VYFAGFRARIVAKRANHARNGGLASWHRFAGIAVVREAIGCERIDRAALVGSSGGRISFAPEDATLMLPHPDARRVPWPQYANAVIELVLDGKHLVLTPLQDAHPGEASGPVPWRSPIWILTAGDPYPLELSAAENARRMSVLCQELDDAGIEHRPALCRSPDGSTQEPSRALHGVDRAQVCSIAARHDQLAVYEIETRIDCVDVSSGVVVTSLPFNVRHAASMTETLLETNDPPAWRVR